MGQNRRLFYRVGGIAWLLLGCVATITFSYLPGKSSSVLNFEAWFAAFPVAWTAALLAVRHQNRLPSFVVQALTREMSTRLKVLRGFVGGCGCLAALPFLFMGCATSAWLAPFPPKFQVEQDHGVWLPSSAVVRHRENSGVPWMDSHATAEVVMSTSDLPKFVKQLEPAPPNHLFGGPWQEKKPDGSMEYTCRSKNSDGRFFVTVAPAKDGRVQVKLGTVTD